MLDCVLPPAPCVPPPAPPPREYQAFRVTSDGELQGVGMLIANESVNGHLLVLAPIKGGPADRAGVLPGKRGWATGDVGGAVAPAGLPPCVLAGDGGAWEALPSPQRQVAEVRGGVAPGVAVGGWQGGAASATRCAPAPGGGARRGHVLVPNPPLFPHPRPPRRCLRTTTTGDEVTAINGESMEGWSGERAARLLRGKGGTEVRVKLARRTEGVPGVASRPEPRPSTDVEYKVRRRQAGGGGPLACLAEVVWGCEWPGEAGARARYGGGLWRWAWAMQSELQSALPVHSGERGGSCPHRRQGTGGGNLSPPLPASLAPAHHQPCGPALQEVKLRRERVQLSPLFYTALPAPSLAADAVASAPAPLPPASAPVSGVSAPSAASARASVSASSSSGVASASMVSSSGGSGTVGYLRLTSFSNNAAAEMSAAIKELEVGQRAPNWLWHSMQ